MPRRKLTDAAIRNLPKPERGQTDYFDTWLPAFGIRVSYAGSRSFFVMTRKARTKRLIRVTLGRYPAMSLSEAREAARGVLDQAASGIDPRTNRRELRIDNRPAPTFGEVSDDFMEIYANRRLRPLTIRDYKRLFNTVAGDWRNWAITEIKKRDVLRLLDQLEARGTLAQADSTKSYLRSFFNWAVSREYLEHSPMEGLRLERKLKSRERVLTLDELKEVWRALLQIDYPFGPLLRVLLLTGQRRGEVVGMRWGDLRDWNTSPVWDMPGTRTKNKKPHLVPIIPAVKVILNSSPKIADLVFTTSGGPVAGFSKIKRKLDALISISRTDRGINSDMPHWVFHDFRRSFSTHANETLGIDPHVVEAVLNHISGTRAGVAGVYNRATYLDERRDALDRWAELVTRSD